ncbi:hypothetical protein [Oleiagrimonas sp.]|jgi:glucose/arabinose dehydrogenase|uniref:hypothetical protein n=1 Tax=Oleiagrimonas sp. TaxID=2010330 RepID=UPI002601EC4D|nr:hypothetical protein [Oleiagrimonas sp.]MDA3914908.1 hypothetical protein [Oleiagrimonas sp.]
MAVRIRGNRVQGHSALITGFEKNGTTRGRPADVLPLPDGSLLVSDDFTGAVYRVTNRPPNA